MPSDFFDPTPEQQNLVLIDAATVQKPQRLIAGCEACSEDGRNSIRQRSRSAYGFRSERDGYVLAVPARCLQCGAEITEKMLAEWSPDAHA